MTRWRILPTFGLSLFLGLSLVLTACGDNTPTTAPTSTTVAPTTAAAPTIAPTTAVPTTAVLSTAVPTTVAPTAAALTTAAISKPVEFVRKIDTLTLLMRPTTLALDPQGNLYTFDYQNYNIVKFDPNGKVLTKWGKKGTGDGEFQIETSNRSDPKGGGLAIDHQGIIYFADTYNHRVQKFDSNGNFVGKWSNPGTGDGQFQTPGTLIFDKQDNFYLIDVTGNNPIQKFDRDGNFLAKVASKGTGEGQVSIAAGFATDSQGNFYVSDVRLNGPAVDAKGNQIFANFTNRILKFDSNGKYLSSFGSSGFADGQFKIAGSIVFDSQDNMYIADEANGINKFNKAGKFVTKVRDPGNGTIFTNIIGFLVDDKDNFYASDPSLGIYEFRIK